MISNIRLHNATKIFDGQTRSALSALEFAPDIVVAYVK